jgi:hypothetical protein
MRLKKTEKEVGDQSKLTDGLRAKSVSTRLTSMSGDYGTIYVELASFDCFMSIG